MERSEPLISISCNTFNHARYIRACLDGFLMQEVEGGFEILIHDDASTDGTSDIIKEYAEKYPEIIFPLIQTENQYSKGIRAMMARFNFPRARGKYIALCEGDDYWTDPKKLAKQIDCLNQNPDAVLCFHDVHVLMPDGELKTDFITKVPNQKLDIETVAKSGNFIHTPTVVFRNVIGAYDPLLYKSVLGDFTIQMVLAEKGVFVRLPEIMCVYRYGVGEWSTEGAFKRGLGTAKTHLVLAEYFSERKQDPTVNILLGRVAHFLRTNAEVIVEADMDMLLKDSNLAGTLLLRILTASKKKDNRINELTSQSVHSISTALLVKQILSRFKQKLMKS